ncbi:DUF541 domain-containing protein [Sphingomonas gilva]|uniref:DUF541 domain-containing protein n=2 Tax=Sphingomonas gilva TaxID=2305907 RepID=A0A396RN28_9SPHN|nr:DUF541 domain-containing protein [Sphingomonas gilva]
MTVAAALALAGCGRPAPDPRGVDRDETLLQVSAAGRAETRPDEARFAAGVSSIAASAAAATQANNEAMNKVFAALEALGIGRDDMQTRALSVSRIDYGRNRGQFEANNMVEVRVRKVDGVGAAVAAATQAGANIVSGPDLRISDTEAASRSAYAAAYKAARARAETYADAAGLKIARVLAIRDGGDPGRPIPYYGGMAAPEAVAQAAAPPVSAGTTTSEVRVSVDFALSAK